MSLGTHAMGNEKKRGLPVSEIVRMVELGLRRDVKTAVSAMLK